MLTVTATDLNRLMACNGSRLIVGHAPPIERDNTVRNEGVAAHWLCQQVHAGTYTLEELAERKAPNGVYIQPEMIEYCREYINAIIGGSVEQDYSLIGATWQINGRWDGANYKPSERTLYIPDLKYGWHLVEPERNWTLISHAIGWMTKFSNFYPVDRVVFTIYQPRAHHYLGRVRSWSISIVEFDALAIELQTRLSNLTDIVSTSKHCYKCPALAFCPAAHAAEMNCIEASENAFIDELDNDTLSLKLDHLKRAQEMLKQLFDAYEEDALHRVKAGQKIKNYGIDQALSNTNWNEGITPNVLQALTGKRYTSEKLVTPTEAKRQGLQEEVYTALTGRKITGSKLVRIDLNKKAAKAFKTT